MRRVKTVSEQLSIGVSPQSLKVQVPASSVDNFIGDYAAVQYSLLLRDLHGIAVMGEAKERGLKAQHEVHFIPLSRTTLLIRERTSTHIPP